jgi:DNA-binding NarL/FixJ family response regulator
LCRSSALALRNIQEGRPAKTPGANLTSLPPRLSTVARLLAAGNTNKQIARHLELSPHTVKDYVDDLIKRFGVHNRTEVAVMINRMSGGAKAEPAGFALSGHERRGLPIEHF